MDTSELPAAALESVAFDLLEAADRRAAGNRLIRWVYQRYLEAVLFGRMEGSTGPIWKMLNQAGLGGTVMSVSTTKLIHFRV